MTSPKGFPVEGRREDLTSEDINLKAKHSTVTPLGQNRRALDVNAGGYYEAVLDDVVEAGSTSSVIVRTGHAVKKGDLIRIKVTANNIQEEEMFVEEVIDANSFRLAGDCSAEFTAGDTFDVYRFVTQKLAPDGGSTATLVSPPIQINVASGGSTNATTVLDDQDTPANTVPIPVRLYGTSSNINITADELNVQTTHNGGTPDSMQIGDGVEIMQINASGEAQVRDDDANTALAQVNTNLGTIETDIESLVTLATALNAALASVGTDELRVNMITAALPTGAATEATLQDVRTALQLMDNAMASVGTDQIRADIISSVLPTGAATETTLQAVRTSVELLDNIVNGSDQAKVAIEDAGPVATQATLASVLTALTTLNNALVSTDTDKLATESDQLPASLGPQTSANSLSVALATDAEVTVAGENVLAFAQVDYSISNVITTGYTQIIGDIGATAGKKVIIFHSSGTPLLLATGAAASEVDRMMVIPGGFNHPVEISLAANSRISVKALGSNVTTGQMIINVVG